MKIPKTRTLALAVGAIITAPQGRSTDRERPAGWERRHRYTENSQPGFVQARERTQQFHAAAFAAQTFQLRQNRRSASAQWQAPDELNREQRPRFRTVEPRLRL